MGRRSQAKVKVPPDEQLKALIAEINPNPAVLALPLQPTDGQKVWWNRYIGKPFQNALTTRGNRKDNGVSWTRTKFLTEFCSELYPDLTPEERVQYQRLIGEKFYHYLTNHSYRDGSGITLKEPHVKCRGYGYDVWRNEKPDEFAQMKTEYLKTHPECNEDNIGNRRSLYAKLFKLLPASDQADYKVKAQDKVKAEQALDLLLGKERDAYNENIPRRLKALMREFERRAKARVNAQVLTEDGDGNFLLFTVASDSLKEFQTSAEIGRLLRAMREWVGKAVAKGKPVKGGAPELSVYGDESKDMFPVLPDYTGVTLAEGQRLLRSYITMVWMFLGGVGKVPWEEISNNIEQWIDPDRMPVGAEWKDPSSLSLSAVLIWLDYFVGCQNGAIPPEKRFQFCRVIAGVRPIAPERSQEASRQLVRRANKDTWVIEFNDTVTSCHQPTGMKYSDASQAYAEFVTTGNFAFSFPPPDNPPDGTRTPTSPIDSDAETTADQALIPSTSAYALAPDTPAPAQPTKTQKARPKMKKARAITPIDHEAEASSDQPPVASASKKALPKRKKAHARKSRGGSDSEDQGEGVQSSSDSEGDENVDYEKLDRGADSDGLSSDGENSDAGMPGHNDEWDDESHAPPAPPPNLPTPKADAPAPPGPAPPNKHPFGSFDSLPTFKDWPAMPKGYNGLLAGVKERDAEISAQLDAWYELGAKFQQFAGQDAEKLTGMANDLPAKWQPIVDFVWITTQSWKRAAEAAPSVFEFAYNASLLIRESFPYTAAARRFRDIADMMNNDQWDLKLLEQIESRVNKGLVELRWLEKELRDFEALSREWCVKLVGSGHIKDMLKNAPALHTFAMMLLRWAEATECEEKRLISSRKSLWPRFGGPLDEARSCMRPCYRFGCPSAPGQLESIKACLMSLSADAESSRAASPQISTAVEDAMSTLSQGEELPAQYQVRTLEADFDAPQIPPAANAPPPPPPPAATTPTPDPPSTDLANTKPAGAPDVASMPVFNPPSYRQQPAATTPLPDPPATDHGMEEAGSADKPAAKTKNTRGRGQKPPPASKAGPSTQPKPPPASKAGPSTRPSTRSSKAAAEPPEPPAPARPRASKRLAEAANGGEEPPKDSKRRKTVRR